MSEHLSQDRLLELAYGELPPEEAAACEAHALGCAQCARPLQDIRRVRRVMAALPAEQPPASAEASLLAYAQQAVRRPPGRKQGSGWSRWLTPLASVLALSLIAVVGVRVAREGTPETLDSRHASSEVQWAAAPVAPAIPGDLAKASPEAPASGEDGAALAEKEVDRYGSAGSSGKAAVAKSLRSRSANKPEPRSGGAAPGLAASPAASKKMERAVDLPGRLDDRLEDGSASDAAEIKVVRKDTPPSPVQLDEVSGSAVADKEPATPPVTPSKAKGWAGPPPAQEARPSLANQVPSAAKAAPAATPPSSAMEAQRTRGALGSVSSPTGNVENARERPSLEQVRAALVEARGPAREPLLHRLCVEEQRSDHEAEALGACRTLLVEFPHSRWASAAQSRLDAAPAHLSPQR